MADFLSRLAERTLGSAEVVRPRIAPLFAAGVGPPLEESPERSVTDVEPQRQWPTPLVEPVLIDGPRRAASETSSAAPGGVPDERAEASNEKATEEPGRVLSVRVSPRPAAAPSDVVMPPREAVAARAVRQVDPPLLLPRRHTLPDRSASTGAPRVSAPPAAFGTSEVPSAEGPPPGVRAPLLAPTVRVTVGRVEVRAVFAAPETPRPAPEAPRPSLNLDEYLKQRREGTR
jgi:hypothetical protein